MRRAADRRACHVERGAVQDITTAGGDICMLCLVIDKHVRDCDALHSDNATG